MHPRPDLIMLQCAEDEVQIGLDPRWSIRMNSLTPQQLAALLSLPASPILSPQQRKDIGETLLHTLQGAGALLPGPPASADESALLNPDARGWAHLCSHARGNDVIDRRARGTTGVLGLGRTGVRIAQGLATAGVGRLILDDDRVVQRKDLGLGGYSLQHVGTPRRSSSAQLIADNALTSSDCRTVPLRTGDSLSALDVVVVVGFGTLDPGITWRLMAEGVAHLPVIWGEASVTVGPLVLPGRTACWQCIDLARRDADHAWPLLVAQLVAAGTRNFVEESTLAGIAAALTVGHVLGVLDGRPPTRHGVMTEIRLPGAEPQQSVWQPHPECGCHTFN